MEAGQDPEAEDENPGLQELFRHYDDLYFRGALAGAGFSVERAAPRAKTISSFGYCSLGGLSKITLYKPMPRYRTNADLKNALLHLMIHGIVFVKRGLTSLGHGPAFRDWMDAINTSSVEDYARPTGGYCITTTHDFSQEKSCNMQGFLWKCDECGNTLVRAKGLGPPSDSCCIENVSEHPTCRNKLCHWHNHKKACRGKYVVTKPAVTPGQKMAPKGTTKMSKSQQGAVQQSDSDEVQENSSLKKARKRNIPEDFQKAIVVSAAPRRKQKQELVAWAMREHLLSNNVKSLGSSTSKKGDDSQKAIVLSAAPRSRRLKRKQSSVTSEEHGLFSPGRSCNNANSPRSNTSRKDVQRFSVQPSASQKKPKLGQGLAALEKHISRPAATQSTVKQPAKSSSSMKTRRQHRPEDSPMITVQPAAPLTRSKRKQSNRAAPARQAARSEARGSAKEKEYVCFSLWLNFYESECSSGSAEPLVNKRTVQRRRDRERLVQRAAHSRSMEARPDEEVSSGQTEPPPLHLEVIAIDDEVMAEAPSMDVLAPPADQVLAEDPGAGGQSQPPAPSMNVVIPPADHGGRPDPSSSVDIAAAAPADQVMAQAHADQSQPPAPCSIAADQVVPVPPRSADPPGLTPPNPTSWPAVIDISDDDDD
ncbi:actin cytoskeleton-regulatory complex protein PAN1-like isoform X2 [Triticum dicoccoides]|uniref:SprT-like domain-containing protein n=2 Tax=Triticum aestivum TaxID=4565 RepID=A0A3B6PQZ0_WHEAT|nr:actin cytoskeleton-regulatory complex protein PAN1-like isoform X2 [Triticum dicoccoides]XP_044414261.1 actin cytoskeleton-regulatory complex protein PAN1-like isoform X2 [Triticum aestivum]